LPTPSDISETAGEGVAGRVEGHGVRVGARAFVAAGAGPQEGAPAVERRDAGGALSVHVSVDGVPAGEIMLADPARRGVGRLFQRLRGHGVTRIVLATGDRQEVADAVALGLGLDAIRGGLTPEQKVDLVVAERSAGRVLMIGDGVNDAPALAAADVGMAMGARGAAASAETADVVLLVDRLDRVLPAIRIARRARAIAVQSVVVGIGLSVAGMIAAAFGQITPVQGALLQEAIDVAVILNALRALRAG
jgi:P-type E1-E2 ATPase